MSSSSKILIGEIQIFEEKRQIESVLNSRQSIRMAMSDFPRSTQETIFAFLKREEGAIEGKRERERNEEKETLEILAKTRIASVFLVLLELSGAESFRFFPGSNQTACRLRGKESA